jgi:hypothetical protein
MGRNAGCMVETKTGKTGRTYHKENMINRKIIIHIDNDEGKDIKMLCDPKTIKIIGYID